MGGQGEADGLVRTRFGKRRLISKWAGDAEASAGPVCFWERDWRKSRIWRSREIKPGKIANRVRIA
jgi:hypothetical protein